MAFLFRGAAASLVVDAIRYVITEHSETVRGVVAGHVCD